MNTFFAIYDKLAGGTLGNWLAIIGVLSLIYWAWRIVAAVQHREPAPPKVRPAAAEPLTSPTQASDNDIAVIAAAVHAMLGAARILHLEPDRADQTWAIEGRWMQQTSHEAR